MNIGDTMPYGIRIATSQGGLSKAVTKMHIAPVQGSISKAITGIKIAPVQGSINKKIYIGGGMLGDVNNDGEVSITDYTLIRLHYLGESILTQEEHYRGDVNQDGVVDETDYDLVRTYILEL